MLTFKGLVVIVEVDACEEAGEEGLEMGAGLHLGQEGVEFPVEILSIEEKSEEA